MPGQNRLLIQLLEWAAELAMERKRETGHWALFVIITGALKAYRENQAGALAKHVMAWEKEARTTNSGLKFPVTALASSAVRNTERMH